MLHAAAATGMADGGDGTWTASLLIAAVCLAWYIFVGFVCGIGYVQILRNYLSPPKPPVCISKLPRNKLPHLTILRPVCGIDPHLSECLRATFHQTYPLTHTTIHFCVESRRDPSYTLLSSLVGEYKPKGFDIHLFVEEEDPALFGEGNSVLGPNPKIRNLSRAYREAKGDLVWVVDCNVWIGPGVAGRMVDKLCGFNGEKPYKFVHQLPIVVDTTGEDLTAASAGKTSGGSGQDPTRGKASRNTMGGRLEEMFLSTAHAKFYTAINTVSIAPCIVGKSNMFRRSHLALLTSWDTSTTTPPQPAGIDFFSHNICEDHLIGDLLWRSSIPGFRNHGLVLGDLSIQPMARVTLGDYVARRVRWLRVRKFTVTLATLVEPGTESVFCSLMGSYALTTLPYFSQGWRIPPTWSTFLAFWFLSVSIWACVDWTLYRILQSGKSIEVDENTPAFAKPLPTGRRNLVPWLTAYIGREALAFWVWLWAVWGGAEVGWRGRKFWVGVDMRVHEIPKGGGRGWKESWWGDVVRRWPGIRNRRKVE